MLSESEFVLLWSERPLTIGSHGSLLGKAVVLCKKSQILLDHSLASSFCGGMLEMTTEPVQIDSFPAVKRPVLSHLVEN